MRSLLLALALLAALPAAAVAQAPPEAFGLPPGFQPEGIAIRGNAFYVGSLRDGSVFRGNLRTGEGSVLVGGRAGRVVVGIEVDRRGRIFAAGGTGGGAFVFDARTGEELRTYAFPGAAFVNDVAVARRAAYFTDSRVPLLHVVPLSRRGQLVAGYSVPLSGDLAYGEGFNANGIDIAPNGRDLIVVQSATGKLFKVDPGSGVTREIDLGGADVRFGDGILRRGRILYVVQNQLNRVAVLRLGPGLRSAALLGTITDPDLDVPTTVAASGPFLFAVNARFSTPPTPETSYSVVRLPAAPPGG